MMTATTFPELQFTDRIGRRNSVTATRYQITFARGAVIECENIDQARERVARHLERAALNGLEDRVVEAIRLLRGPT